MTTLTSKPSQLGSPLFYKKALAIALPVMAQLLVQNLVSLIDNFMVAGLGDVKMSGVNIAGQINFMFMVFVNTISMSGGIFMAQYNGAKDSAGMQQAYRFKIIVCSISALLYMLLTFFFPSQILSLMVKGNLQSEYIVMQGVSYMKAASFSWIPMAISLAIGSSLREIGNVRAPLIMSIIATCVNTFFNWVFIYGNLGSPRLEVRGAAIATIIARIVEMILFAAYITKKRPPFFSHAVEIFKVKITLFFTILRKSGIILVSEMIWVLSETVTVALYNTRGGAEIVSGMAASFSIANLFFICFNGIHTATGVIMGSTLGANRLDEARSQKNWILNGAGIFGFFAGLLGCLSIF
ncbi:MAG: MATE family efflux transporter, partial [Elusimicrobia bacterium]|nr:MATE family efflux transporter [Elusimicrobiota bacterium]